MQRRAGTWRLVGGVACLLVVVALVAGLILWRTGAGSTTDAAARPPSTSPSVDPASPASPASPSPPGCSVSELLVPSCGRWWGVAANPLGTESWHEALPEFESMVGRTADIAHYYNASPQLFPTAEMIARAREPGKERLLLLNWKPEMGRTWAEVAAGDPEVDAAIDAEAAYLRATFPERFFLVIHHEPEDEVQPAPGSGMTAADYRAMYRHVVTRLRAGGVTNAVFVMNYVGTPHWGSQDWFEDLYPGDDVVDWIAEDPYLYAAERDTSTDLAGAVDRRDPRYPGWPGFYTWATTRHPGKPLMLAEWGVTHSLPARKRSAVLAAVPSQLASFPQLKAMVYWNARREGTITTVIRPGSPQATALRHALADPALHAGVRPPG